MKIGIISSWNDTLSLQKILTKYDHDYIIYHNQTFFPFWQKDFNFITQNIQNHIDFLVSKWAETIILDPIYELHFRQQADSYSSKVLNLFETYLQESVLPHSLVWKIWLLTDFCCKPHAQSVFQQAISSYQPTQNQLNIKKFSFPFSYRTKTPTARDLWISTLWIHNPYLIKTIKNDLRYFKDANIDTLIPLHYHYFQMSHTIKSFFNHNKTHFYDRDFLEKSFKKLTSNSKSNYSITIYTNQSPSFITSDKKLLRLLQRWKQTKINITPLT